MIKSLPIPCEALSDSVKFRKRTSKESGLSSRVECRMEYMVRNENAAEEGLDLKRRINSGSCSGETG